MSADSLQDPAGGNDVETFHVAQLQGIGLLEPEIWKRMGRTGDGERRRIPVNGDNAALQTYVASCAGCAMLPTPQ